MVKFVRWLFFHSWFFQSGKDYFCSSQSSPPRQVLVGNPLRVEEWKHRLTIFSHTYLGFIPGCHQGAVLPYKEPQGKIHKVDHAAVGKGLRCARVHKHFSYPSHTIGCQRFWYASGTQIPWLPTQIHPRKDGVPEHLLTQHDIPIHCQNQAKVQREEERLWIFKSEAQRIKVGQGDPRKPVKAAKKEQCHEVEEGHRKVVWVTQESHS